MFNKPKSLNNCGWFEIFEGYNYILGADGGRTENVKHLAVNFVCGSFGGVGGVVSM